MCCKRDKTTIYILFVKISFQSIHVTTLLAEPLSVWDSCNNNAKILNELLNCKCSYSSGGNFVLQSETNIMVHFNVYVT